MSEQMLVDLMSLFPPELTPAQLAKAKTVFFKILYLYTIISILLALDL